MSETLTFDTVYQYNTLKAGITLTAKLSYGETVVDCEAKVDTGASYCIFKRIHGEYLGINIESGIPERIGTVTDTFQVYGHTITLTVLGIETTSVVYFAADEYFSRNVLGRQGWLDRVKLGLIDYEAKLFLSVYEEEWKS